MTLAAGGLVETGWLADHLGDPDLRIYDCTVFLTPNGDGTVKIESDRAHGGGIVPCLSRSFPCARGGS